MAGRKLVGLNKSDFAALGDLGKLHNSTASIPSSPVTEAEEIHSKYLTVCGLMLNLQMRSHPTGDKGSGKRKTTRYSNIQSVYIDVAKLISHGVAPEVIREHGNQTILNSKFNWDLPTVRAGILKCAANTRTQKQMADVFGYTRQAELVSAMLSPFTAKVEAEKAAAKAKQEAEEKAIAELLSANLQSDEVDYLAELNA